MSLGWVNPSAGAVWEEIFVLRRGAGVGYGDVHHQHPRELTSSWNGIFSKQLKRQAATADRTNAGVLCLATWGPKPSEESDEGGSLSWRLVGRLPYLTSVFWEPYWLNWALWKMQSLDLCHFYVIFLYICLVYICNSAILLLYVAIQKMC